MACTNCCVAGEQCSCAGCCIQQPAPVGSLFAGDDGAFYAGFELVFLRPSFETSDGLVTSIPAGAGLLSQTRNFDHNFEVAPRVHAGYVGPDGFGVRFRVWDYDHSATTSAGPVGANGIAFISSATISPSDFAVGPLPGLVTIAPGDRMQARHSLQMSTWDVEATQQYDVQVNTLLVSGGVRYMQIEQRYEVARWTASGGLAGALDHDHDFEGIGPTIAAEWIHPFGDSGLSVYGNGRGSVVFGTRNQTASGFNSLPVGGGPVTFARQDRRDQNAQVGIGEVGIGLQFIQGRFAARAGYEGQLWTDVGTANTLTGNMGLHGFAASIGIDF